MKKPYIIALNIPLPFSPFVKKLTVRGIIGKTQGVINAITPPNNPNRKIPHKVLDSSSC